MKRNLAILLAAVLLVSPMLFGCTQQEAVSPEGDGGEEQITITFPHWYWSHGGSFDQWIEGAVKDFTDEHPNVKVEPVTIAYEEYWNRLDIAIAAGTPYDIMAFGDNVGNYIENGHLLALDDYIDMDELKKNFNDIQNVYIPELAPDGKTYMIANVNAFYMPIYRPSVLKKAGWDSFPQTFDEFKQMCGDLQAVGVMPYGMMTNPGNFTEQWIDLSVWVIAQGGSWMKNGTPNFTSDEVKNAYSCIKELYDAGYIVKDTDKGTYRQMFGTGEIGVLIDGSWVYSTAVLADPSVEGDFAVADTSLFPANKFATAWEGFAASADTKYPEECGALLMALTSAPQMRKFLDTASILAPRTDIFDDTEYEKQTFETFPWLETFVENADNVQGSYPTGVPAAKYTEFTKIAGTALESVLYDNVPVDTAMQTAQESAEALLKS